jgi:hypothetical protein
MPLRQHAAMVPDWDARRGRRFRIMSTPISQPAIPAQPLSLAYGIQDLALLKTYSRDSYLAAFGVQAPAWDPSRVRKTWFDSTVDASDPSNVAVYKVIAPDSTGTWAVRQLVMPASEAAAVNLPGLVTYPPYAVAPTQATRGGSSINPNYLSLESDARAMMALFGGANLYDEGNGGMFPIVYPANEPRRAWDFMFKGTAVNVGALLMRLNANGVGAPGTWDASGAEPVWIPAPTPPDGVNDMRPPRPVPVRALLPNEKLQAGLMGVSVVRTDLQQQSDEAAGQFTPDDRATLQQIYRMLSAVE